jgi:hypothetical protein
LSKTGNLSFYLLLEVDMNIATGFAERLGHWRVRRNARKAGDARTANAQPRENSCGRGFRSKQPIAAYVGANGSGKTLAMVHDTLPSLYEHRTIYTTVPLTFPDGTIPDNVVLLHDWSQILNAQHADILLDEVSAICSSRDTDALPPQVATLLQQLRKRDLVLRWTAPNWARADRILRETTMCLTVCRGFFPRRQTATDWPTRTFFLWRTYDSANYTDFASTNSTVKHLKPLQRSLYFLPLHRGAAPDSYDSLSAVTTSVSAHRLSKVPLPAEKAAERDENEAGKGRNQGNPFRTADG